MERTWRVTAALPREELYGLTAQLRRPDLSLIKPKDYAELARKAIGVKRRLTADR